MMRVACVCPAASCSPVTRSGHSACPPPPAQTLLDDPDLPGFQPALPDDFNFEQLAKGVREDMARRK